MFFQAQYITVNSQNISFPSEIYFLYSSPIIYSFHFLSMSSTINRCNYVIFLLPCCPNQFCVKQIIYIHPFHLLINFIKIFYIPNLYFQIYLACFNRAYIILIAWTNMQVKCKIIPQIKLIGIQLSKHFREWPFNLLFFSEYIYSEISGIFWNLLTEKSIRVFLNNATFANANI